MGNCDSCNNQFCKSLIDEYRRVYRRNCIAHNYCYSIPMGSNEGKEVYQKECPFCHRIVASLKSCNLFCSCNAKYYVREGVWLDRNTGKSLKEE